MKKIILLCGLLCCCFLVRAQTLSAATGTHYDGTTVTITGVSETNDSFIDLQDVPSTSGTPTIITPANPALASEVYINNFHVTHLYNPVSAPHASTFTVDVHTSNVNTTITAKFNIIDVTFTDINNPASTFNHTLTITLTIAPGTAPPKIYNNTAQSGILYNNTCSAGSVSTPMSYTVPANTVTSTVSVADANAKAIAAEQAVVNANNPCVVIPAPTIAISNVGTTVSNNAISVVFAVGVPTTYCTSTKITAVDQLTGAPVLSVTSNQPNTASVVLPLTTGHTYSITATCYGPGYTAGISSTAIPYTVSGTAPTYNNVAASVTNTKNNCTVGTGTAYTYTVPAGTYSSQLSQAAADAQAQTDLTNNGQTQANLNGQCITSMPFTITNNTQELGYQLKFVGPTTIYYNIPPGGSTVVQVPFGTYTVSVIPTGGNQNNYSYTLAGMQSNTAQFIFTNITIYTGSPDSSFLMKPI